MNGLESITQKIIDDAIKKASDIKEKADNEAKSILEKADEQIKAMLEKMQTEAREAAENSGKRIVAGAQLEGKKEFLKAKQEIIDEAFQKAASTLASLDDSAYETLIKKMSAGVSGEIEMLPRDKKSGTGGGFIAKNGKVEVNCSFEALVKNARERLEKEIVEILF